MLESYYDIELYWLGILYAVIGVVVTSLYQVVSIPSSVSVCTQFLDHITPFRCINTYKIWNEELLDFDPSKIHFVKPAYSNCLNFKNS